MKPNTFISDSEQDTIEAGKKLASELHPGDVVCLHGDLGAGKTHFTKGVASFFGIDQNEVNSPTFVIIQEYPGQLPVYHFDGYRLKSPDEAISIGARDYFFGDGICVVEWPEKFGNLIPDDAVHVYLLTDEPGKRRIHVKYPD